jgi:cyclopropane fatty-acyl-phospholipid synthase-like methyltransferase
MSPSGKSAKQFSDACERNRDPILAVLRSHFSDRERVLEIGSGTGQHAAYFAKKLPTLIWQASDRAENLPSVRAWLDEIARPNTPPPFEFDVRQTWPTGQYDALFSANTLHIMSWSEVETLFRKLPSISTADAKLAIYGPFNYDGQFTSDSNAAFDRSLKSRGAQMGIRDFEAVNVLASSAQFALIDDVPMPANNHLLVWQRQADF